MRSFFQLCALALPLALLTGCGNRSTVAYGDANSIILVAPDSVWEEVGATVQRVLEPRILTVRDERTFDLTAVSPADPDLVRLRLWRQVIVVGQASDPWVAAVLVGGAEPPATLPAIVERDDIWARGQRVTAVVLPPGGGADELVTILPELHQLLDQRFRNYARARMFVSGRNDSLQTALRAESGFGILLPTVYTVKHPNDNTYLFRNDNMVGGELVRMIQVTWHPGSEKELKQDEVLAWRDRAGAGQYWPVQQVQPDLIESRPLEGPGAGGLEVRGAWRGDIDGYPMAGPFISRVISCPEQDRTYLVDSWLYAPAKDKYEYMLQLETILDTFECGA
jgi:hypothetical protein